MTGIKQLLQRREAIGEKEKIATTILKNMM